MNKIKNVDTMVQQANADAKRIVAKKQSDKNKVLSAMAPNVDVVPVVGGKMNKQLGKVKNAQADEIEKTQLRKQYIKESKADNTTVENAWRLAVKKAREANPGVALKDLLKIASCEYKKR